MSIEVDYRFPSGIDPDRQAKMIALGQTVGTWDAKFADREATLKAHLAEVVNIQTDSLGSVATIAFPEANVEGDISSLLTAIFGKYSLAGPAKIIAVRLPQTYGRHPKIGLKGIRERLGINNRPLVMAIFKPALGMSPEDHATVLRQVAFGGLDIIKDEEILGDLESAPTRKRLEACLRVIQELKEKTGRNILYAVNVTGSASKLLDLAEKLVWKGANALLLNVLSYGFSVLDSLRINREINVPIFAHPALAGTLCGSPEMGFAYSVLLGTFMAHGGADAVLYPSSYGNFPFDRQEEMKIREILQGRNVFPVPSAGINPSIVPQIIADYGSDVILNAGTSIMDHPDGPAAGVQAFLTALEKSR